MFTIRDLKDQVDFEGNVVVRRWNEQSECYDIETPLSWCADFVLDSPVSCMYVACVDIQNMTDAPAIVIEIKSIDN